MTESGNESENETETEAETAYPPASWTVEDVRDALAADGDVGVPTVDDAAFWQAVASDPVTAEFVEGVLDGAERARNEPVPALPATLYADYERTGNRARYERPYFERHHRLAQFALAECLQRDGAYLDDVLDEAWAICEQTTWLLPAHLPEDERRGGLPSLHDPADHHVALFSARTAHLLAEVDHLLGDRLHPALRERLRREVDERVLTPFEERDDYHWRQPPTGNWAAVCNAGAAIAALSLEDDLDRLARLVVKAVRGLEQYLESFGTDGCCPEGLIYWDFGLGHYVMLAAALAARTDGELSLLTPPILPEVARFPLRIELSPGRYVPFSDSRETDDVDPYLACWLGDAFDVPALVAEGRRSLREMAGPFDQRPSDSLMETVRNLQWCRRGPSDVAGATPPRRFLFEDAAWWIARVDPTDPDGLVVAAKGGHNGEPHNHNDCGSFVVHYGRESPVTDLGSGTYDRDYFSGRRYEYLTARSLGHSVPVVNGHEQATGREYAADVLEFASRGNVERFSVELSGCYPTNAGVSSLERTIELDRTSPEIRITDAATFDDELADPTLESVSISYVPIEATQDGLAIEGQRSRTRTRLEFDPTPDRIEVERLSDAVDFAAADGETDSRDVWRARVTPPVESGRCELETAIVPSALE